MAQKTGEDKDLNPAQADYDRKFDSIAGATEAETLQDMEENFDQDADPRQEDANIASLRDKEQTGDWKSTVGQKASKSPVKLAGKGNWKRRGIIGAILGAVGIGGFSLSTLLGGGGLLINFKQQLADKLMDATPALFNARSTQLMRHKLGPMTSGTCSVVTIACKFKTMSVDKQVKNFADAKITVHSDGTEIAGGKRIKPAYMTFEGMPGVRIEASNIRAYARQNADFARALNKAFNPRLHATESGGARWFYKMAGISKQKPLKSSADVDEMKASLRNAVAGRTPTALSAAGITQDEDGQYRDSAGNVLTPDEVDELIAKTNGDLGGIVEKKKSLLSLGDPGQVGAAALKGSVLIGTGLIDSACTAWTIIRTAGFAAKYLGALQMVRYANVYFTTADAIKAGDATPEEVEFLGNIITSQNIAGDSGMDSRGWNYAMYGDITPIPGFDSLETDGSGLTDMGAEEAILASEITNYINGEITSDTIMGELANLADSGGQGTDFLDSTCGFVKSGWGQAIVIGIGGAALIGCIAVNLIPALGQAASGSCFTANTAVSASISMALAVTLSLLSPWLISLATDSIITGDENGNQAVNAAVSGAGAMNAMLTLSSGGGYLSEEAASEFNAVRQDAQAQFALVDTAELGPFDITSANTFAGTLVGYLSPFLAKTASASQGITSTLSMIGSAFQFAIPRAAASSYGDAGVCKDTEYERGGIATDINCNPLVGQGEATLNKDVDQVLDAVENIHINATTGAPMPGSPFADFQQYCLQRTTAFGDGGEVPTAESTGEICKDGSSDLYDTFRAYQSLLLTNQGLDLEEPEEIVPGSGASGQYVSPVDPGYQPPGSSQDFGPRSCSGCSSWHKGVDLSGFPGGSLGKPVYAITDGTVIASGIGGPGSATSMCAGLGSGEPNNIISIRHDDGTISNYYHVGGKDTLVNVGDRVTPGQRIASINNCGQSGGSHLHFEVSVDQSTDEAAKALPSTPPGTYPATYVNPVLYMALKGVTL